MSVSFGTTDVGNIPIPVTDNGGSLTVDAVSLPLPTGASTAALQTQPGIDIGDVTVNNGSGVASVNIQDGGNSITVDGTVTANQGTAVAPSAAWPVKLTDGSTVANIDSSNSSQYVTSVGGTLNNGTLVTVSQVATQLVAANASRKMLLIKVIGNAIVAVGTTGITATTGFTLAQNDSLIFTEPFCPRNAVFAIRINNGTVTVLVQEVV